MMESELAAAFAPRRLARILISPEIVATLLGLPTDFRARSLAHDLETDLFVLVVENEHCADVPYGRVIPIISPVYSRNEDGRISLTAIRGYDGPVNETVVRPAPSEVPR